jgi:hypothetical protein
MGRPPVALQTLEQRRHVKMARIRWAKGISAYVPAEASRKHIVSLYHRYGMSCRRIAELSGLTTGEISELLRGTRGPSRDRSNPVHSVLRATEQKVLSVQPEEPKQSGYGARVNAIGSIRRVHGLAVLGYPLTWQAEQMGSHLRNTQALAAGERKAVTYPTAKRIRVVYQRFEMEPQPLRHGVPLKAMKIAQAVARSHGYVAPIYWDWDSIDDPDAFPNFTGMCGGLKGVLLHEQEGSELCPACEKVKTRPRRS